jgi:HAD superfamily hydrolase (TIGR01509 family)
LPVENFDAVIFDMDGVVTRTTEIHAAAWKQVFDEVLRGTGGEKFQPFQIRSDYAAYVDGKSREDGIASFLTSREIELPKGDPEDAPGLNSHYAIAKRKNELFLHKLKEQNVQLFDSTIAFIASLKESAKSVGLITASTNANEILNAADVLHLFDVAVTGIEAERLQLSGKPEPDIFYHAAGELGVDPDRVVVVEDAVAGVEASRKGNFGLVIGVDRLNQAEQLYSAGADVVVDDLRRLSLASNGDSSADLNEWILQYDDFDEKSQGTREALCALGNGYFCTRAAATESRADGVHYPGTYIAGIYNGLTTPVNGTDMWHEDLVNIPNWLSLSFKVEDEDWFDLQSVQILTYQQSLDLRQGLLSKVIRFVDGQGRTTTVSERRFVHMRHWHLGGLEVIIEPENWSGKIKVKSAIDGNVRNAGASAYAETANIHLECVEQASDAELLFLKARTSQTRIEIALACQTNAFIGGRKLKATSFDAAQPRYVEQTFEAELSSHEKLIVQKLVAIFTSRDPAISECGAAARREITYAPAFAKLITDQVESWKHLWRRFDLELKTDEWSQTAPLILRLHIFHVLQTASPVSALVDVGIPARGWTGEAYRGHIFWDDLFVFPFLNMRIPEISRAILKYRYLRLTEARRIAKEMGLPGACYPWQSASDGREQTADYNWWPQAKRWARDLTAMQIHVNAAIAYNVWQYYQVSTDVEFLNAWGAEIMLEVARFFAAYSTYNEETGRFEIRGVMGPDEYHSAYPGSEQPGINNNAYTNVMAVWTISTALELLALLPDDDRTELCEKLDLRDTELRRWQDVSTKMYVPIHNGIIEQFDGYNQLEDFPHDEAGRINERLLTELLLEGGGYVNRYKVSKQADVLMLFYVFSAEELQEIFSQLGYEFDSETIARNVEHYKRQTAHNSTLSRVATSWVLSKVDPSHSWTIFLKALESDYADIQGGSTREGIHMGAMAGTIDIVQRCYTGIVVRNDVLWIKPRLPKPVRKLRFGLHYRGQSLQFTVRQNSVKIVSLHGRAARIHIGHRGKIYALDAGESISLVA